MKVVTRARGPDAGGTCLRAPSSGPSGHLLSSALPSVAASGRRAALKPSPLVAEELH
ncbi:hypothetical protein AZ78_1650 [Lysobacter capsici AZ78]|uniref:Uncharacterized protein n=1 Tax=Lysobacter capsici AZ78 TaxID=1444315 RepID=A0A125MMQ0_9GAMM|nr:hypothetical protein AZ78_1650 [Lysobacter capsici AZ78]